MNQLVELGKHAKDFKKANTEVIAVFREEQEGKKGLTKIKNKTKTPFNLALDNGKEKTARYSQGRRVFSGYVIDPQGKVTKIIEGDLKNRAKSAELLKAIAAASGQSASGSETKGSASKKGAAAKGSGTKKSEMKGSKTKGSSTKKAG